MRSTSISTIIALTVISGSFALLTACQPAAPQQATTPQPANAAPTVEYLASEKFKELGLPFSEAVRVGNILFLSGQIGNVPGKLELAAGGIAGETRQTLDNIKRVLEANGSSLDRVVKVTVMLADIAEWPALNEVYVTYFPNNKPARSAFAASGLALGARVEIEVIATVDVN